MARISVLGGTGYTGSAVVKEAASRGHQVTSVSRHEPTERVEGVDYLIGSVLDPDVLEAAVRGHDVVVEAVSPRGDMVGKEEGLVDRLIELTPANGTRLGVVGGVSSLLVEEGGPRLFDVNEVAPEVLPEIETGLALLETLRSTHRTRSTGSTSARPCRTAPGPRRPTPAATGSATRCCSPTTQATR